MPASVPSRLARWLLVGVAVVAAAVALYAVLGIGGAASVPVSAEAIARSLHGTQLDDTTVEAAVESIGQYLEPGSDVHATAEYRVHLARVLAARVLRQARDHAAGKARGTRA